MSDAEIDGVCVTEAVSEDVCVGVPVGDSVAEVEGVSVALGVERCEPDCDIVCVWVVVGLVVCVAV